ncbi:C3AR protein, partial [Heliornis fulica]|nr:C3AR protein [Heliornis fulica]
MPQLLGNSSSHEEAAEHYAPEAIASMAIFIIVFIIGIPGNGLVIWVAGLKMKRSVNIIWFLNLAVADFMCCLSLPFSIVHLALNEHWPYDWFLCKVIPSVITFTMFASVFLLVAISIDRCLLVMKPVWCQNHRTLKFTALVCSGIWVLAFVFCCPVFHYRETTAHEGKTECGYSSGEEEMYYMDYSSSGYNGNDSWGNFYEDDYSVSLALVVINITRAVFGFVLPFGIMAGCYALIAFRMRANRFHKPRNRTLRTIMLVVTAFFICWAPYHVVGIMTLVPTLGTGLRDSLLLWDHLSIALAYANSCINPLLYVFVGRDFRAKAQQTVYRILEGAFSEEPTHSIPYSLNKTKTSTEKDVSSTL